MPQLIIQAQQVKQQSSDMRMRTYTFAQIRRVHTVAYATMLQHSRAEVLVMLLVYRVCKVMFAELLLRRASFTRKWKVLIIQSTSQCHTGEPLSLDAIAHVIIRNQHRHQSWNRATSIVNIKCSHYMYVL